MSAASLSAVPLPDRQATADRFFAIRDEVQVTQRRAWIGALVVEFSNDELRLLAEMSFFNIHDTLTLRRLGLLTNAEGYDGTKGAQV